MRNTSSPRKTATNSAMACTILCVRQWYPDDTDDQRYQHSRPARRRTTSTIWLIGVTKNNIAAVVDRLGGPLGAQRVGCVVFVRREPARHRAAHLLCYGKSCARAAVFFHHHNFCHERTPPINSRGGGYSSLVPAVLGHSVEPRERATSQTKSQSNSRGESGPSCISAAVENAC